MEGREGINPAVTVIAPEAPSAYHVAPRNEVPNQVHNPEVATAAAAGGSTAAPAAPAADTVGVSPVSVGLDGTVKKKRGRPRKYGPDGSVNMPLSPLPISSSAPPSSKDFSSVKQVKPQGMEYKRAKKFVMDHLGEMNGHSDGTNFMPHFITVNAGEDITNKVISFSQQGPRAICVLSATGVISNVTLRHPDSSGGTLTYEGRFEILSLSGSFMPTDTNQGTRSRAGGMSVSLASPDGRVVGGGVAGVLIAATPVQVVVGSFLPSGHQDLKTRKPKSDYAPATFTQAIAVSAAPPPPQTNSADKEDAMGGGGHVLQNSGTLNSNFTSPPPTAFRRENWVNMHSMPDTRKAATDINISLPDN